MYGINMSYCRFSNTLMALKECEIALYNKDIDDEDERKRAKKLIALCKQIAEDYNPDDIDGWVYDEEEYEEE